MNRKQRKAEERARKAEAAAATPEPQKFETEQEANDALAQASKVVNMKQRAQEKAKKEEAKTAKAGAASTSKKKERTSGLPQMPKLPKARKAKPQKQCECGCETMTSARYAPGHDSYQRGWVIRVERGVVKIGDVPEFARKGVAAMVKARKTGAGVGPVAPKKNAGKVGGPVKVTKTPAEAVERIVDAEIEEAEG